MSSPEITNVFNCNNFKYLTQLSSSHLGKFLVFGSQLGIKMLLEQNHRFQFSVLFVDQTYFVSTAAFVASAPMRATARAFESDKLY